PAGRDRSSTPRCWWWRTALKQIGVGEHKRAQYRACPGNPVLLGVTMAGQHGHSVTERAEERFRPYVFIRDIRRLIMAHELPPLPYDKNALAPHISEETLEYHYGKHHAAYVK